MEFLVDMSGMALQAPALLQGPLPSRVFWAGSLEGAHRHPEDQIPLSGWEGELLAQASQAGSYTPGHHGG